MLFKSCIGSPLIEKDATLVKGLGYLLLLEIDEVLVVSENLDVGESAPGVLNFFSGDLVL